MKWLGRVVRRGGSAVEDISNSAWAAARLIELHAGFERLLQGLWPQTLARLEAMSPQGLSNVAWAYATALLDPKAPEAPQRRRLEGLFGALAGAAERCAGRCKAQELANVAWAFARAAVEARPLFARLAAAAVLEEFTAQNLCNFAWAFATVACQDAALQAALGRETSRRLEEFNLQGLSNLAWAAAVGGRDCEKLVEQLRSRLAGGEEGAVRNTLGVLGSRVFKGLKQERHGHHICSILSSYVFLHCHKPYKYADMICTFTLLRHMSCLYMYQMTSS